MNIFVKFGKLKKRAKGNTALSGIIAALALGVMPVSAQQIERVPSPADTPPQKEVRQVYGWQLMTEEEREAHRQNMRGLQSREERQQYREEHRQKMQERAKAEGITLPEAHCAGSGKGKGKRKHDGCKGASGGGRHMGRNMPVFADFDTNSDGRIGELEFTEAHNKRVQQRASEGRPMRNRHKAPVFTEIDADKDGAVSPAEFSAYKAKRREEKRSRR